MYMYLIINTLTCVRIMNDITVNLLMKCRKYENIHNSTNSTNSAEDGKEESEEEVEIAHKLKQQHLRL